MNFEQLQIAVSVGLVSYVILDMFALDGSRNFLFNLGILHV